MSNISFKDFSLRSGLSAGDCIVGYDGQTGDEIRIKASNLVQKGEPGESVQIQFSTNAQSWHFPAMETDMYIRFRAGSGAWSTAIRIGVPEPETNNGSQNQGGGAGNPLPLLSLSRSPLYEFAAGVPVYEDSEEKTYFDADVSYNVQTMGMIDDLKGLNMIARGSIETIQGCIQRINPLIALVIEAGDPVVVGIVDEMESLISEIKDQINLTDFNNNPIISKSLGKDTVLRLSYGEQHIKDIKICSVSGCDVFWSYENWFDSFFLQVRNQLQITSQPDMELWEEMSQNIAAINESLQRFKIWLESTHNAICHLREFFRFLTEENYDVYERIFAIVTEDITALEAQKIRMLYQNRGGYMDIYFMNNMQYAIAQIAMNTIIDIYYLNPLFIDSPNME